MISVSTKLRAGCVAALLAAASGTGCFLRHISQDMRDIRHTAMITGRIHGATPNGGRLYAVHFVEDLTPPRRVHAELLPAGVTEFGFFVDPSQSHRFAAFQDTNDDKQWEPGEPWGVVADSVQVEPRQQHSLPDISLLPAPGPPPLDLDLRNVSFQEGLPFTKGEVTTLDNPAFDDKGTTEGVWAAAWSAKQSGFGVFFLEEYDAKRIPVVFIHGMRGSPRDFREMIDSLDHARYQAWVARYPSGMRLATISRLLGDVLLELKERFHVPELVVVAHSMGGLVAREVVLGFSKPGSDRWVSTLVTISTPYEGHSSAQFGARHATDTVPSWVDLTPSSEFLQTLHRRLPREVHFFLFFTYGGRVGTLERASDGTVTVASQLPPWIQSDADRLYGVDRTHGDVLTDPEVFATLKRLLQGPKPAP